MFLSIQILDISKFDFSFKLKYGLYAWAQPEISPVVGGGGGQF
jgi:hypothetical protein